MINIGGGQVGEIYVGSQRIKEVRVGNDVVFMDKRNIISNGKFNSKYWEAVGHDVSLHRFYTGTVTQQGDYCVCSIDFNRSGGTFEFGILAKFRGIDSEISKFINLTMHIEDVTFSHNMTRYTSAGDGLVYRFINATDWIPSVPPYSYEGIPRASYTMHQDSVSAIQYQGINFDKWVFPTRFSYYPSSSSEVIAGHFEMKIKNLYYK